MKAFILKTCAGTILLLTAAIAAGASLPDDYRLGFQADGHRIAAPIERGVRLTSNSIIDIKHLGNSLWLGTGNSLAELHLSGTDPTEPVGWSLIGEDDGIGRGGVSALWVDSTIIWAATAYSENTEYGWKPAGGGVGYSEDNGDSSSWTWYPQPVDDPDVTDYNPTTTNIQNVTYDIALTDSAVWIASYGGGLRKFIIDENRWVINPPDLIPFAPLLYLNHRCFSVVAFDSVLFVGTAGGINRSFKRGVSDSWKNFRHEPGDPTTITGNFVTALAVQNTASGKKIWAATWVAEGASEFYGVSVSSDYGETWRAALSDSTLLPNDKYLVNEYGSLKAHNFGFRDDTTIYVAADGGLWISYDGGLEWDVIQSIYDPTINECLEGVDFFSVAHVGDALWVGTDDGLAVGWWDNDLDEYTWRIHRSYKPAGTGGEPDTYAYPNPFSPLRGHRVRFQVSVEGPSVADLVIYNFAMEKVYEEKGMELSGGGTGDMADYGTLTWDGRDTHRKIVANGVYFYRIKMAGNTWWGKVMVLD